MNEYEDFEHPPSTLEALYQHIHEQSDVLRNATAFSYELRTALFVYPSRLRQCLCWKDVSFQLAKANPSLAPTMD